MPGNDSYCPLEGGPWGIVLNGSLKERIEQAGLSDLVHLDEDTDLTASSDLEQTY